jgi:hypothetical protein
MNKVHYLIVLFFRTSSERESGLSALQNSQFHEFVKASEWKIKNHKLFSLKILVTLFRHTSIAPKV